MLAGAKDFLSKPPSVDELTSTIRRVGAIAKDERNKSSQVFPTQMGSMSGAPIAASTVVHGKIIVVYSPKGGTGATTIATNLAICLHSDQSPTVLVDGNMQFGDVAIFLNEQGKNSIIDLTSRADELDPDIVDSVLLKHATSGIKILPAPHRPEDAENVNGDQFVKVLKYLSRIYPYVVVDASSELSDVTLGAMDSASAIILVTTQDIPSLKNCRLFLDLVDALGLERANILFVMNRFDRRLLILPEKISENFKQEIVAVLPLDERVVVPSINRGVPFVISGKSQEISKKMMGLADTIRQRVIETETKKEETIAPSRSIIGKK
jgi:pilus assembly protein CpaE